MTTFPLSFPPRGAMVHDLEELGIVIDEKQIGLFGKFAGILLERSYIVNLIGPREKHRLWRRHFLESVSYTFLIDINQKVVDIGSGNGFPGIVLAIMGFNMILLEPKRKKHLFLDFAVRELGLDNCKIIPERLEDFNPGNEVKQFVARAVAPPASLLEIIGKIAGKGSVFVYRQPEIAKKQKCKNFIELKYPPLDRRGFLVQYLL
jgi:16S rRNA (guanine527-N7)-methyltransferase